MQKLLALVVFVTGVAFAQAPAAYPGSYQVVNDTSTGTTFQKLAKLSSGKAILAGTSDTTSIGICVQNCTTSGSAIIAFNGIVGCVVDATTTIDHWVVESTSVAGDCHDTGSTTFPTSGVVVGQVVQVSTGAASVSQVNLKKDMLTFPAAPSIGDFTKINEYFDWSWDVGDTNTMQWKFLGVCAGPGVATGVAGEGKLPSFNAANCYVHRGSGTSSSDLGIIDFASGSTPLTWAYTARANRSNTGTANIYFGFADAYNDATQNFIGLRYKNSTAHWECVVISGGSDVVATNTGATPDTAVHTLSITNGAFTSGVLTPSSGAANSVTCAVGASSVTVSGTIPAHNWIPLMGVDAGTTAFSIGRIGLTILGLSQ